MEPCPSFYLRTARAYKFLGDFLEAAVGRDALGALRGLRQRGERRMDLAGELDFMRELFYGLYLVSAEDIGSKPTFLKGERVDRERCYRAATEWLARAFEDEDLAADTRVSVPIYVDSMRGVTRLWATLGVRMARLDAQFDRPPSVRPTRGGGAWSPVELYQTEVARYLIPVDVFAEIERPGLSVLTREELRVVCDREETKEAIVAALRAGGRGWGRGRALVLLGAVLVVVWAFKRPRKGGARV